VVVVVGNPNVGKTTLFNRLSGQNARVGNYPGITVERRTGKLEGERVELVDVPGAYSLSARSGEEQIALASVLGLADNPKPDLVVVVLDAGQLIRNSYLMLQLAELGIPLVCALNMIDETAENPPDPRAVGELFGVPCVATNAREGLGIQALHDAIKSALSSPPLPRVEVRYPPQLKSEIDRVANALPEEWRGSVERDRALALWALTSIDVDDELEGIPDSLRAVCREVQAEHDVDREIVSARYAFLDAHSASLHRRHVVHPPKRRGTQLADRVLLHPVAGFVIFVVLMLIIFQALFSWSDPAIGAIEAAFGWLGTQLKAHVAAGIGRDFLTEGILSGVGNVVVFLPQILLLFLFIGLLEDSGYMSRVAYLMDRVMRLLGLHGRAFVPMLSGFACAVPAIMATRTMERRRDRLLTMMVIPLMTCSARLPVYTLIIAALFPPSSVFGLLPVQGLLMVGMYLFSVVIALVAAAVLGRTVIKGKSVPLILELPPYRLPSVRVVLRMMWDRARMFLKEAGTVILACTVVLWALLSFPRQTEPVAGDGTQTAEVVRARALEQSYAGRMGKAIEPVFAPLGFDWKIDVGIIGAFAAREVFVSTLGIVYAAHDEDEDDPSSLRDRIRSETKDGRPAYTPLTGLSLMVFFALAGQCMSTLAVVWRETKNWRWPVLLFGYMTALAYAASFLVYQVGRLLGFA
jgi:ferrous iron transport protein B